MPFVDLDSIHVPAAGTRPPAAWGLQVNANFDAILADVIGKLGQWTPVTPTLTQSVTVSKTITYCRYIKLGRLVTFQGYFVMTSNGTANNPIAVGLPFNAVQASIPGGNWYWSDLSGGVNYEGTGIITAAGTFGGLVGHGTAQVIGQTNGAGVPNQLQTGDAFLFSVTYESTT